MKIEWFSLTSEQRNDLIYYFFGDIGDVYDFENLTEEIIYNLQTKGKFNLEITWLIVKNWWDEQDDQFQQDFFNES